MMNCDQDWWVWWSGPAALWMRTRWCGGGHIHQRGRRRPSVGHPVGPGGVGRIQWGGAGQGVVDPMWNIQWDGADPVGRGGADSVWNTRWGGAGRGGAPCGVGRDGVEPMWNIQWDGAGGSSVKHPVGWGGSGVNHLGE